MAWTYDNYSGANYGIIAALIVVIVVFILLIFCTSDRGKDFVTGRIIGVSPKDADDGDDDEEVERKKPEDPPKQKAEQKTAENVKNNKVAKPTKFSTKVIGGYFCFLAMLTLSLTAVLVFQGCILGNVRITPDDPCPTEYPYDCFVFNGTSRDPLTQDPTFRCDPKNTTQFPAGLINGTALCFGWIIRLQTTDNVLNQLGVCTGLLGLFTAILALIAFLGKSFLTLILCVIFIVCCVVAIALLLAFKWSYSPLTYAVLLLGAALGIFGVVLFIILRKTKKKVDKEQNAPSNPPEQNPSAVSNVSSPLFSAQLRTTPSGFKPPHRSVKVAPK